MTKVLLDWSCGESAVVVAEDFLHRQALTVAQYRAALDKLRRGGVFMDPHGAYSLTPKHPRVRHA